MTKPFRLAAQPRLLDQITVEHGPRADLAAFFLAADRAARDRGVTLSLSTDFAGLAAINAANQKSWDSLAPSFDHRYGGIDGDCGFCLIGRNEFGDVVSTQAARFYDLQDESLADCIASFRFFYADPARHRSAGETCILTAPSAARIGGRVIFSGSTWVHPDYRKRGLPMILPRISRALALTRWDSDYTISFVKPVLVEKGVAAAYGYRNIEHGLEWRGPDGDLRYKGALIWMTAMDLLADMAGFRDLIADAENQHDNAKDRTDAPFLAATD